MISKFFTAAFAVTLIFATSIALGQVDTGRLVREGDQWIIRMDQTSSPQAGPGTVMMYDNYTPTNFGGQTTLTTVISVGGDEYGDSVNLANYQQGIIDSAGFTLVNNSTTSNITAMRVEFKWYNADDNAFLGGFILNTGFAEPRLPGSQALIEGDIGTLRFLNIPLAPRMIYTTKYLEVFGGANLSDVGMLYGGPVTVGSSDRFIVNRTTGQQIDLGSADQNLGYFIRGFVIPAPGSVLVLTSLGLFASRRRR
ncbi:MAG: hypothetical protein SFZ23_10900 [Planctomycetota bacterium]|nr:hypothetical protein [Planctomycetota bacterium]